jgi:hypothetical protein
VSWRLITSFLLLLFAPPSSSSGARRCKSRGEGRPPPDRQCWGSVTFILVGIRIRTSDSWIQIRLRIFSDFKVANFFFTYFFLIIYPQAHYLQSKKYNFLLKFLFYNFILQLLFQSAQHLYENREGSGSVPLTNGPGSERPKNMWILRIRSGSGFGSPTSASSFFVQCNYENFAHFINMNLRNFCPFYKYKIY